MVVDGLDAKNWGERVVLGEGNGRAVELVNTKKKQ
jgi:hypothetical protein